MIQNRSRLHAASAAVAALALVVVALTLAALVAPAAAQDPTGTPAPTFPSFPTETNIPFALSGIWGVARDQNIVIRSGPGTDYPRIGLLRAGASIDITGTNGFDTERTCTPYFANDLDMWVEVRFGEQVGWIARCTLTIRGDNLAKLPIEAPPPAAFTPPVPTPFPGARG